MTDAWWRDAVIYQVYPRSWADDDGDGVGDLPGITSRLPHLASLGVDALWLSPFYRSPQNDGGYDVSDARDVDPLFGTLDDFDALVARAHELGLRVVVDVVPNHTSSEHPWFQAALSAPPESPERARYVFRDGRGEGGELPPNNWVSNFGGPAWSPVDDSSPGTTQWFLHLFDVTQPDLDWTNPEVADELDDVLRFWAARGVDGFRIDVAHGMVKAEGLPDVDLSLDLYRDETRRFPMWDQPGVHDVHRRWRRLVDELPGDLMVCGEAWVEPPNALALYVRPDELHQTFNFGYLMTPWDAPAQRAAITSSLASVAPYGAPQTWVLSNHDVVRHATRLGRSDATVEVVTEGIGPDDPQPDVDLGLRRARAATALMLALPGSAYLYQGEELGLPDATTLADDDLRDPTWERSGHARRGRDGCRVPVPWEPTGASCGFSPTGATWLPQPDVYRTLAAELQDGVEGSTLELYRRLLRLRRERRLGRGELTWVDVPDPHVVAFTTTHAGRTTTVLTTVAGAGTTLPADLRVLASSAPLDGSTLPPDTTVWLDGSLAPSATAP